MQEPKWRVHNAFEAFYADMDACRFCKAEAVYKNGRTTSVSGIVYGKRGIYDFWVRENAKGERNPSGLWYNIVPLEHSVIPAANRNQYDLDRDAHYHEIEKIVIGGIDIPLG